MYISNLHLLVSRHNNVIQYSSGNRQALIVSSSSSMALQPGVGQSLFLFFGDFIPKVSWSVSVHSVVSDRLTDSILMRLPEPSGRQSGDLGEKWPLEFCLRTSLVLFMPEGSFTCRKSTTWDRRLYFPSEVSCATDFLHP
jgi:hypothetical protein